MNFYKTMKTKDVLTGKLYLTTPSGMWADNLRRDGRIITWNF